MNTEFLTNEFNNLTDSNKGLALAIDQFLTDNLNTQFPPFDLASRFGIEPSKLRQVARSVLKLGTKTQGQRFAQSSKKGVILYCLPYEGEGANNCYIASPEKIDPRTGKEWANKPTKK